MMVATRNIASELHPYLQKPVPEIWVLLLQHIHHRGPLTGRLKSWSRFFGCFSDREKAHLEHCRVTSRLWESPRNRLLSDVMGITSGWLAIRNVSVSSQP
jgi:hypothetical protein